MSSPTQNTDSQRKILLTSEAPLQHRKGSLLFTGPALNILASAPRMGGKGRQEREGTLTSTGVFHNWHKMHRKDKKQIDSYKSSQQTCVWIEA